MPVKWNAAPPPVTGSAAPSSQPPADPGVLRRLLAGGLRLGSGALASLPALEPGLGSIAGAAIAGGGEAAAEKVEGRDINPYRVGTEAALGAVPLGAFLKAGRPLESALKSGALASFGEGGREWSEGNGISPGNVITSGLMGGVVGGFLGKLGMPKAEAPPSVVVESSGATPASPGGKWKPPTGPMTKRIPTSSTLKPSGPPDFAMNPDELDNALSGFGESPTVTPEEHAANLANLGNPPPRVPYGAGGTPVGSALRSQLREETATARTNRDAFNAQIRADSLRQKEEAAAQAATDKATRDAAAKTAIEEARTGQPVSGNVSERISTQTETGREGFTRTWKPEDVEGPGSGEPSELAPPTMKQRVASAIEKFFNGWLDLGKTEPEAAKLARAGKDPAAVGHVAPAVPPAVAGAVNPLGKLLNGGAQEAATPVIGTSAPSAAETLRGMDPRLFSSPVDDFAGHDLVQAADGTHWIVDQNGKRVAGPFDENGAPKAMLDVGQTPAQPPVAKGPSAQEVVSTVAGRGPVPPPPEPVIEPPPAAQPTTPPGTVAPVPTPEGGPPLSDERQRKIAFMRAHGSPEANAALDRILGQRASATTPGELQGYSVMMDRIHRDELARLNAVAPVTLPTPAAPAAELRPTRGTPGASGLDDLLKAQGENAGEITHLEPTTPPKGGSTLGSGLGGAQDIANLIQKHPQFATRLGLAAGGALLGGVSNPLGNPLMSAAAGAALGAGIPSIPGFLRAIGTPDHIVEDLPERLSTPEGLHITASEIAGALPGIQRFNLLTSVHGLPANVLAGPWGSGMVYGLEMGLSGDPRGWTLIKRLVNPREFIEKTYDAYDSGLAQELVSRGEIGRGETSPLGRMFGPKTQTALQMPGIFMTAGDMSIRNMMIEEGFTEEEARRATLTSNPELPAFKTAADLGKTSPFFQFIFPFRRTLANIGEQGATATPGLGWFLQKAREKGGGRAADPALQQVIQQLVMTPAVAGGSYELGKHTDPETAKWLNRYVTNAGGKYSLAAGAGFTAGQAMQAGVKSPEQTGIVNALNNALPLPSMQPVTDWAKFLAGGGPVPRGIYPTALREAFGTPAAAAIPKIPTRFLR